MCSKIRKDSNRNANNRDMLGVELIEDKLKENRRWFRHICHRPIDNVVKRSDMIICNDNTRRRGKLKVTLDAIVSNDMIGLNLSKYLALIRAQLCKIIHIAADSN